VLKAKTAQSTTFAMALLGCKLLLLVITMLMLTIPQATAAASRSKFTMSQVIYNRGYRVDD